MVDRAARAQDVPLPDELQVPAAAPVRHAAARRDELPDATVRVVAAEAAQRVQGEVAQRDALPDAVVRVVGAEAAQRLQDEVAQRGALPDGVVRVVAAEAAQRVQDELQAGLVVVQELQPGVRCGEASRLCAAPQRAAHSAFQQAGPVALQDVHYDPLQRHSVPGARSAVLRDVRQLVWVWPLPPAHDR